MFFYSLAYEWEIPGGGICDESTLLAHHQKLTKGEFEELVLRLVPKAYQAHKLAGGTVMFPRCLYPAIAKLLVSEHEFVLIENPVTFAPRDYYLKRRWMVEAEHRSYNQGHDAQLAYRIVDAIIPLGFVMEAPLDPNRTLTATEQVANTINEEVILQVLRDGKVGDSALRPFRPVEG